MALDLNIFNGVGDGNDLDGSNASLAGNPSGNAGQVLASDTTPTSIFQSEIEGLNASTTIVLQANGNITSQSNLKVYVLRCGLVETSLPVVKLPIAMRKPVNR